MVAWCGIWCIIGAVAFSVSYICSEMKGYGSVPKSVEYDKNRVAIYDELNPVEIQF